MAEVVIVPEATHQLLDLIDTLYDGEYFGFLDSSIVYTRRLFEFIYSIPEQKSKRTSNQHHGQYYCKYKHNRQTTWFFTFDMKDDRFIVRYVINNHTSNYPRFIAGIS